MNAKTSHDNKRSDLDRTLNRPVSGLFLSKTPARIASKEEGDILIEEEQRTILKLVREIAKEAWK